MKKFLFLVAGIILFLTTGSSIEGAGRINPLRFGEEQKAWQLTFNVSRSVNSSSHHLKDPFGLWKVKSTNQNTLFNLESSIDLDKNIGFRGGFSFYFRSSDLEMVNLWTGEKESKQRSDKEFGNASLKLKYTLRQSSELETYFLIPILGGSATAGLSWSKDPVMIFPKLSITKSGYSIDTDVSFVTNSKIALTGGTYYQKKEKHSVLGFSGGVVYRNESFQGIQLSFALERSQYTTVIVELGMSYGEEKS